MMPIIMLGEKGLYKSKNRKRGTKMTVEEAIEHGADGKRRSENDED